MCGVRPALERGGMELVTGAYVERLETDVTGRSIRAVHALRVGESRSRSAGPAWWPTWSSAATGGIFLRTGSGDRPPAHDRISPTDS